MNEPLNHSNRPDWPQWHNQSLRLTLSEIDNPTTVIDQFFQCYHLPDIRTCLNAWLQDALSKDSIESKQHVSTHKDIEKLVEATWLMHQKKTETKDLDSGSDPAIEEPFGKPVRLIEKVEADPLFVIKDVFQNEKLDFLKENVSNWLQVALSNDTAAYESGEQRGTLFTFYHPLQLLIEALYVINNNQQPPKADLTIATLPDNLKHKISSYHQPVLLRQEQKENPMPVIIDFFKQFPITYVRRELWDWCSAGISYTGTFPESMTCDTVLITYESVLCLVEAAVQLSQKNHL
jgi:hypothetical protein